MTEEGVDIGAYQPIQTGTVSGRTSPASHVVLVQADVDKARELVAMSEQ